MMQNSNIFFKVQQSNEGKDSLFGVSHTKNNSIQRASKFNLDNSESPNKSGISNATPIQIITSQVALQTPDHMKY